MENGHNWKGIFQVMVSKIVVCQFHILIHMIQLLTKFKFDSTTMLLLLMLIVMQQMQIGSNSVSNNRVYKNMVWTIDFN